MCAPYLLTGLTTMTHTLVELLGLSPHGSEWIYKNCIRLGDVGDTDEGAEGGYRMQFENWTPDRIVSASSATSTQTISRKTSKGCSWEKSVIWNFGRAQLRLKDLSSGGYPGTKECNFVWCYFNIYLLFVINFIIFTPQNRCYLQHLPLSPLFLWWVSIMLCCIDRNGVFRHTKLSRPPKKPPYWRRRQRQTAMIRWINK